jgi:hypothetical protein
VTEKRGILLLALTAGIMLASSASASGHASAWKPIQFRWEYQHQSFRTDSGCDVSDGSAPPATAWKSEQMTVTGNRWVLGSFATIIYSGRRGGPDRGVGGLDSGGQISLQRRVTQVIENCSDRTQFVRTCSDAVGFSQFPPMYWLTNRRTRRTRFSHRLTGEEVFRCRGAAFVPRPPDFYLATEETPSVLVPLRAFYGPRTRVVFPERRFTSTGSEIDPDTHRPYTVQGTVTYALQFTLKRYVERRAACRDRRPQHHFVCSKGTDHNPQEPTT